MDEFESMFSDYRNMTSELVQHCIAESKIDDLEFAELAVFLGFLHGLKMIHHAHHWQSMGQSFYGDHTMYQRLYTAIEPEIDVVAEKLVGLGGLSGTNYFVTVNNAKMFMDAVSQGESIHDDSLRAELVLLIAGEEMIAKYKQESKLSVGLEQALGNIQDVHETHAYLLQQRRS